MTRIREWSRVQLVTAVLMMSMAVGQAEALSGESAQSDAPIDLTDAVQGSCPKGQLSTDRGCVIPPDIRTQIRPQFPHSARQQVEGKVVLNVTVEVNGTVGPIEVVESMRPGDDFEKAVISAVKRSRFSPAKIARKPVRAIIRLTFDFTKVSAAKPNNRLKLAARGRSGAESLRRTRAAA